MKIFFTRNFCSIKIFFWLLVLIIYSPHYIFAQSSQNYSFLTDTTANFNQDINGNAIDFSSETNLISNNTATGVSSVLDIGFNFYFMGVKYDKFTVHSQGTLGFGTVALSRTDNNLVLPQYQPPTLAPFWDYIRSARSGFTIRKKLTGTAPNRALVVEWHSVINNYSTNDYDGRFQLRIYETTGIIEFVYDTMKIGTSSTTVAASIGFTAGTADNTMISVTDLSTYAITRTASLVNNMLVYSNTPGLIAGLNSRTESACRFFRFTPYSTTPATPINLTFTNVLGTSIMLNWVDNSTTETFFNIYRSSDSGATYTKIASVNSSTMGTTGTAYQYQAIGLSPNKYYTWKITAQNEGGPESGNLINSQSTIGASLSGTKTIGPSGNYTTLSSAITDIKLKGLVGPIILELQSNYVSTSETFPLLFSNINTSSTNTITIRPQLGATNLLISGSTLGVIDIVNEDYITFDGRPGGVLMSSKGTFGQLTIENTNTFGTAIRIDSQSTHNTFKYCEIKGVNTSTLSGVIYFGTTFPVFGSSGNNYNLIDHCDIHSGTTTATNLIYCNGLNSTSQTNQYNTISNCNIYDFFLDGGNARGIYLDNACNYWTIINNSFYQTTSRTTTSNNTFIIAIEANDMSSFGVIIHNNKIGGTAPNLGGDSTLNIYSQSYRSYFYGISVYLSTNTPSSIQGNKISRIKLNVRGNLASACLFRGIYANGGLINIGDTTANVIGGNGGTDSLKFEFIATSFTYVKLIEHNGLGNIKNNVIGAISLTPLSGTTSLVSIRGIEIRAYMGANEFRVENNLIGHQTVENNIYIAPNNYQGELFGIYSECYGGGTVNINNNIIANLYSGPNHYSSYNKVAGIYVYPNSMPLTNLTISGNQIFKLTANNTNNFDSANASVMGISIVHTPTGNCLVKNNNIHSLYSLQDGSTYPTFVTGIFTVDSNATSSIYESNYIHHLVNVTNRIDSKIYGMDVRGKNNNIINNMIQLGIQPDGTALTNTTSLIGINNKGKGVNIYFNSVFIGGTNVASTQSTPTYAYYRSSIKEDNVKNNIFVNNRSNATSGGKHYASYLVNLTNLSENYNIFLTSGTGGVLFNCNSTDYSTLLAFQSATNLDINSGVGNPNFILPNGNLTTTNLHIQSPTPIEASGVNIPAVTTDYDNETRATLTPVDIGADAGNFTLSDVIPPSIFYTQLGNGIAGGNRVLNNFAQIIDNKQVDVGANAPRLYFKKSTDNDIFGANNSSTNGWKYVVSSSSATPYSFTIDYTIIYGGSITNGDIIQYFIAAQDNSSNLASYPIGVTGTSITTITAKPPTIFSYNITAGLSGIKTIPGDYPSLTGAGGLFQTLNNSTLIGNLTVNINSDLTEDGTHTLNPISEVGAGGEFTVTIKPSSAVVRNISGNVDAGLIRLNGVSNLIINGQIGSDSTCFLSFLNSSPLGSTFKIYNDAHHITIQYCNIYGSDTTEEGAVINISNGLITGNYEINIENNLISDPPPTILTGKYLLDETKLIYTPVTSIKIQSIGPGVNVNISIRRNRIRNYKRRGIHAINCHRSRLYDNHFYNTSPSPSTLPNYPIYVTNSGTSNYGHTITGNYIGGSGPYCSGSAWTFDGNGNFTGIYVSPGGTSPAIIERNWVTNFATQNAPNQAAFVAIHINGGRGTIGSLNNGNVIGGNISTPNITLNDTKTFTGIYVQNAESNIQGNQILGIVQTSSTRGTMSGIVVEGNMPFTATNNFVANLRTNNGNTGTAAIQGIRYQQFSSSGTGPFSFYNNIVSLGNGYTSNAAYSAITDYLMGGNYNNQYNTYHIGGTGGPGAANSTVINSYYETSQTININHSNNIIVNNRTGGTNYCLFNNYSNFMMPNFRYDNNFYGISNPASFAGTPSAVYNSTYWKENYSKDRWSQWYQFVENTASQFWTDPANFNYTPKTDNQEAWSWKGWGIPNSVISTDINGNPRSTSQTGGTTCVGPYEYNPTSNPPVIVGSPAPSPGGTTNFTYNDRPIASIEWGVGGNVPVTALCQVKPGSWPLNTPTNSNYSNIWYQIYHFGGNDYQWDLKIHTDESTFGKLLNNRYAKMARYYNQYRRWYQYNNSYYNYYYRYLRLNGLTNKNRALKDAEQNEFIFAIGDSTLPLSWYTDVTTPNGGNNFQAGTNQNITWNYVNVPSVKIEYSSNNGTSWNLITASVPASSGTYSWLVPNTPSTQCLVKISSTETNGPFDISDSTFTITQAASVTVTAPNGGENWIIGSSHNITWTSTGMTNVKIEYTTNNGSNWTTIIASTPALKYNSKIINGDESYPELVGNYAWTIPNTPSTQCKVKISDESNNYITDESNNVFTISGQICKDVSILNGWNILSVPVIASDMTGTVLFPTVASSFYAYSNGYITVTQLQTSKGYWAKFNSAGLVPICGNAVSTNQIQVVNGWNMIGVYDYNVAISGITTTPPGIISSSFYEYNNGYLNPTTLVPGKGYWIKVNQNGTLNLPSTLLAKTEERGTSDEGLVTSEQKIIITDNSGISQTLYLTNEQQDLSYREIPPQPPQGIADIRFGSDRQVENLNQEQIIKMNSLEYPIKIKVIGMDISLKDNIEGKLINKMLKDGEELIITNPQINTIKIKTIELPTEYSLSQNYPNPFNPMTTIQYEIPTSPSIPLLQGEGRRERNVSLKIYDIMGRVVEILVDEPQEAGRYQVQWDATRFSSGIYYYELNAGDFRAIKKMIMMK